MVPYRHISLTFKVTSPEIWTDFSWSALMDNALEKEERSSLQDEDIDGIN